MKRQPIHPSSQNAVCPNCKKSFNSKHYSKGRYQKYCSKSCSVYQQHKRKEIGFENKNPNYIDGRSKEIKICKCGKQVNDYRGKLCSKCYIEKLIHLNKTRERHYTKEYRKQISERTSGEKHPNWQGDKVGYKGLHQWVNKKFGKANKCENKSCNKTSDMYEYSLLKGKEYERKRENFWQLCVKCHRSYDAKGEPVGDKTDHTPIIAKVSGVKI
ncbi:MAG TPA: hypothetical protein ENI23_08795 [bacterium]|nr:hypothetical protein [bacterium]